MPSRTSSPTEPPAATEQSEGSPSIDALLRELEAVVDELESGGLPLERALARFEQGVKLAREGGKLLEAAERRVEVLLEDGSREPLTPGDGERP